mgnify:CR=1 FL=1
MARLNECILYRDFEHGEILDKMAELMNAWEQKAPDLKEKEGLFFECANGLVETAGAYGFSGNLWHCYLTFLLVNNENAFSTACEIRGAVNGSINELALNDFGVFKALYDFDLTVLDEACGESEAVGHHHAVEQRIELRVAVVGKLSGKLLLDRAAAVGLIVLHRQRQSAVGGEGERDRAGRGSSARFGDLSGDVGKDGIEFVGICKVLARLTAVVAAVIVTEVGKTVLCHLCTHIQRVDQLFREAELCLDRAAAVGAEVGVGYLAHTAAEQGREHRQREQYGKKFLHGISPLL